MKKHNYLYIILFLGLYSCNSNQFYNVAVKHIKDITFNNVKLSYYEKGVYRNKANGKEYIWFADPTSDKCIKFFNLDGELCDSTPLTKALNLLHQIGGINVVSMDTIILKKYGGGNIFFIDHTGNIWKKLDIDSIIGNLGKKRKNYAYTGNLPINQNVSPANDVLYYKLHAGYHQDSDIFITEKSFLINEFHSPYFLKIKDLYSTHPTFQFGFNNFWSNIAKEELDKTNWQPNYTLINNKLFVMSPFSDYLFLVNDNSLILDKKIKIHTKLTVIGTSPLKITKKNIRNVSHKTNANIEKGGAIQSIHLYKNKNEYFVIVRDSWQKKLNNKPLPPKYTVILYDTLFHKLGEYQINRYEDNYFTPRLFTSKGFLALKWEKDEKKQLRRSNKKTYGLFQLKN